MNWGTPPPAGETTDELALLIETLHKTGQRLEELTGGEVDAVTDSDGRTFLLRHAQYELRQSEAAKQATILNALPAHIAMLDVHGIIVAVNESWCQFGDRNACQNDWHCVGMNYLEVCDRAYGNGTAGAHEAAQGIRSVLNGRSAIFSIEYACHSPDKRRWFLLTVTPLVASSTHGAVVMHLDITGRVLNAQALEAQHMELRALFNAIPSMVWVRDTRSHIVRVNQRAADATGETITALQGKSLLEIYPEDADRYYADDLEVMRSGSPKLGVVETVAAEDGTKLWMQIDKVPLIAGDGSTSGIVVVATDISETKRAEAALRESERRFNDMLDQVQLASVMLDRQARITYCNNFFLSLTGWQREEVVGRNWYQVFKAPDAPETQAIFEQRLFAESRAFMHTESQLITRSGEHRLIGWSHSVLRSGSGEVIGTASIGEDITDRKAAETVLAQRSSELERFHHLSVGRELQMVELKKQVNELNRQAGREPAYDLAFLQSGPLQPDASHERAS
ncbi:MAG: PAS domain-containing protein [Rhodanobacter sp.]